MYNVYNECIQTVVLMKQYESYLTQNITLQYNIFSPFTLLI
jgi:hypothetical protein